MVQPWIKGRGAAGVLLFGKEVSKICLISAQQGSVQAWTMPKGGANRADLDPATNALRELAEEAGLSPESVRLANIPPILWKLRVGPVHLLPATCRMGSTSPASWQHLDEGRFWSSGSRWTSFTS